jgi:antirestriction protein ArdC
MSDSPHRDPVQHFAYRTPAELENGVTPWVRAWDREKAGGPQPPFNPVTRNQHE